MDKGREGMCDLDPVRTVAMARSPDRMPFLLRLVIAECVEREMVGRVTRGAHPPNVPAGAPGFSHGGEAGLLFVVR